MYRAAVALLILSIFSVILIARIGLTQISDCVDMRAVMNSPCFFNEHIEYTSKNLGKSYINNLHLYLPLKSIQYNFAGPTKIILGYPILGGLFNIPITAYAGDNAKSNYNYVICRSKSDNQDVDECIKMNNQSKLPIIKKGQIIGISGLNSPNLLIKNKSKCDEKIDRFFDMIISRERLTKLLFNFPNDKCGLSVNVVYY